MDLELLGILIVLSHILEGLAPTYYVLPVVDTNAIDCEEYQVRFISKDPVFEARVIGKLFFNHNGRVVAKFSTIATPGQMTFIVDLLPEINNQISKAINAYWGKLEIIN